MDSELDRLSDRDFRRMRELIGADCGVVIGEGKRVMLETRLRKRVRALRLGSLPAYCEYVFSAAGRHAEWPRLIDEVTTHKTDFFREPAHFDYLVNEAIPELERLYGAGKRRPLVVWSAACSTGEEPYTAAMALASYAASIEPQEFRFRIEATDISGAVLDSARRAVYPESAASAAPEAMRRRFLLRSKDREQALVRIAPEIRMCVVFRQLNLLNANYGFLEPVDVVFCRNVMIYFSRETQQKVLDRICGNLRPGGYLMMGHSESLNGLELPLEQAVPTVYRRNKR